MFEFVLTFDVLRCKKHSIIYRSFKNYDVHWPPNT